METLHPDLPELSRNERKLLSVLLEMRRAGEDVSPEALVNASGMKSETVNRLMLSLDKKGYIELEYSLTPKGRAVVGHSIDVLSRFLSRS